MSSRLNIIAPKCKAVISSTWTGKYLGDSGPHDLVDVTGDAPASVKSALYRIAQQFRREFRYDFVQYHPRDPLGKDKAYMWFDNDGLEAYGIGGFCMRWRKWTDHPEGWAMSWIWLHPYFRNRNYLSRAWPFLISRYGDFLLEPPLSHAMEGFARKKAKKAQAPWLFESPIENQSQLVIPTPAKETT